MSMHGQPAGGQPPPQPRLLLYVAEGARASLPDSRLHVPPASAQLDYHSHQYQSANKTYIRSSSSDLEESQLIRAHRNQGKCNSAKQLVPEYTNVDTFQSSVAPNLSETYQTRYAAAGLDSQIQPLILQHSTCSENSLGICSDKDLNVNKNYMNYQCLDQNISHQSIVNQNSVVYPVTGGGSGGSGHSVCDSEGQLLQPGDGIVLAVVPSAPDSRTKQGDLVQTITVPLGWKRIAGVSAVVYISPSGTALSTLSQVREYLQTAGTCKCGLPCPLRPEATFSFDPKVVSKPYQPPTGSELTKLCNHKRKLLATLSSRAQSPATSPPHGDQIKVIGEVPILKKKMKKPEYAASTAPQILMQRDQQRTQGDYNKIQDLEGKRITSPGLRMVGTGSMLAETAPEKHPRVSHYLTVNSGWIQQDPEYKQCTNPNVGLPVLGANGQIIGVNTAFNKQVNVKNTNQQYEEPHELKRDTQVLRPKEHEGQIFSGLNQPLTPEVMQKINEQQQLFIQQNQKQIELAMKGYRAQLETNQNACQNQFAPHGQLIIQNGNVVKTNSAKTPPWQVKRTDSISSPSSKSQKSDNMDFDDCSTNVSEDSTTSAASCNSNETLNQGMCSRVPPLPQHYNVVGQQWPVSESQKKKTKPNKVTKKKGSPDNKFYNANGMRILNEPKRNYIDNVPTNNIPSFMDDPTGYLAQQTALLNNTISRQVGLSSFDNGQLDNNLNLHGDKSKSKSSYQISYKSSTTSHPSQSPNNTPDSSALSDKGIEPPSSCFRGFNVDAGKSHFENQPRRTYSKQRMNQKVDVSSGSIGRDESGVTSSTLSDSGEACPIQARTVSTSNERIESNLHAEVPGPPPAVMHFISNHNINKNLMEVDNIAMVGVRPMPGYCPPPHLGGGPAQLLAQANYAQALVTTMASGFSVTRDTVTSVLAGRADTATTSVNASRAERLPPTPNTAYAIPNNHPDPFVHSVNLPTSYPLHIAGTTAQNMISKSPLEMVKNVICSPTKTEDGNFPVSGRPASTSVNAGQILISSTGQMMLSNRPMPPPPPKVSQQQILAPYVVQQLQSLESQIHQQSNPLSQLVGGSIDSRLESKSASSCLQTINISPENLKKKNKKKKTHGNITNVLQIAAPSNNIVLQSPQHSNNAQFSPRGFQLSPNNSLSPGAMLQALTIMPGKPGTPAHIIMNGQGGSSNIGSQSLIANTSPSQSINLLQPVNLMNNASGVVPNFPAFQQFIVPNLGGVVMTADGAALLQENGSGVPMQLQLQTVNGQNVLTQVQGGGVFASNPNGGGVLLRTQNQQGKIIQSQQHSPGAQFLSPNSQVMMSSPNFNGQLSPLLASLSPPTMAFNTSPHQVGSSNVQGGEFIQANQMSHLMVPLSPKQVTMSMSPVSGHRTNSTFVQNTTIVQQQTIMSNNSIQSGVASRLSFEPSTAAGQKQILNQARERDVMIPSAFPMEMKSEIKMESGDLGRIMNEEGEARSVSTQTLKGAGASSPPDTTTHSPPARPPDTTTRDTEPMDHASAMVQCVSSSEQDMAEAQGHSPWNYESQHSYHESDAQGSMSNVHIMRQIRHNSVESTNVLYNHPMPQNHSHQDLTQIPNDYYDRGQMFKRKCEYEPASYRHEKIMRTSYNANGNNKMMEYDYRTDKSKMLYSNSGPSSDGSGQRVFDNHLGTDRGSKSEYQETRTDEEESNNELSSSDKSRCFEVGDLIWGPVKGYVSWPGKLTRKGEEGKWHVKWFGDKPPGMVDGAKLLTLSEGLEAHHTARTKHRKSRKLNTHLENAIQQAMAELDKKSEGEASTSTEPFDEPPCSTSMDASRRKRNRDKAPAKVKRTSRSPDHTRLRSAR